MRKLLGLGVGLVVAGCGSDDSNVPNNAGDAGSGTDSPATDDGMSPGGDSATPEAGPVEAGPPDRSKCTAFPDKIGLTTRTYGSAPNYLVYVPTTYDMSVPSALIEILHGAGDTTANYLPLWQTVADARNVIILGPEAPNSLGPGFTWDTSDEAAILAELVEVAKCYSIDPKRQILHGYSAGGIMAYMFGLKDAAKFSGIAIFSADLGTAEYYNGGSLLPSSWLIPVSHFHGDQDTNFPISYAQAGITKLMAAGHPTYFHIVAGGGHGSTPTPANALQEYDDLKGYKAP